MPAASAEVVAVVEHVASVASVAPVAAAADDVAASSAAAVERFDRVDGLRRIVVVVPVDAPTSQKHPGTADGMVYTAADDDVLPIDTAAHASVGEKTTGFVGCRGWVERACFLEVLVELVAGDVGDSEGSIEFAGTVSTNHPWMQKTG